MIAMMNLQPVLIVWVHIHVNVRKVTQAMAKPAKVRTYKLNKA
jgi:hypothetical protein